MDSLCRLPAAKVAEEEVRIRAINSAVAERAGEATFHVTALNDASSLLKPIKTDATYGKYRPYHHVAQHLEDRGYRLHSLYNLVQSSDGWGDAIFVKA